MLIFKSNDFTADYPYNRNLEAFNLVEPAC